MTTSATYPVTGMTCAHCVASVRDKVSALVGVTAVDVELVGGGTSQVKVSSDVPLALAAVRDAIGDAGYVLVD